MTHLSDLAERARRCNDPAEFLSSAVTTSRGHQREFSNLCRYLGLDPGRPEDLAKVLDFLRRFRPRIVDKNGLRDEVEELAARWISGEPKDIVAAHKDLVDESIGRTLRKPDVIARLPDGSRPCDLARDPTLHTALDELRARFVRSYRDLLIGGQPLGRRETADLLSALTADNGPRLVLLHGRGGDGKSGVAFELVGQLERSGIPCLPLRLDRDRPDDTPLKFGRSLGLPGSPVSSLAAIAGDGIGVLVLDQVDALRWTAAHSSHAWDTCERIVSEALRHRNLRVVVVCRSFDLDDDPRIRAWKGRTGAAELRIGPLDDETVNAVVASCGVEPQSLDSGQRGVLRSPQGLYLWRHLHERGDRPPAFRTMTDLMREFWAMTRLRLRGLRLGEYDNVLDTLVAYMDRHGTLAAPRTVADRWPDEVAALLSMNVLVEGPGHRLLFAHQSYLEYLTASRVLQDVYSGKGSVLDWLSADDQSLFRRGQLRQLLAILRDDDPERYVKSMREILEGDGVRFHLKHLAFQMLGHADAPIGAEVDLVLDLLRRPVWVDHIFFQVLAGRDGWFDAMHERGTVRSWLEDPDERRVNLGINVIERVASTRGAAVESLLLDRGRERWPGRLAVAVWRTRHERLSDGLFNAVIDLTRRGSTAVHDFVDWKALAEASPGRCLRLLEARIARDLDRLEAALPAGSGDRTGREEDSSLLVGLSPLACAAVTMPVEWWDLLMPFYRRTRRFLKVLRRGTRSAGWDGYVFSLEEIARRKGHVLRAILAAAGRAMAEASPDSFWDCVASETPRAKPVERLLAHCMAYGPDERADAAIRWLLRDPSRLRCGTGGRGAVYRPAWRILRRYAGRCSDALFAELQAAILAHRPAAERDAYISYHTPRRREAFREGRRFDVLECNDLGLGQYLLLSGVPRRRLTPDAQDWAGVLCRKFGPIKPLLKGTPRRLGGRVVSTIPGDRLSRVSDQDWLRPSNTTLRIGRSHRS